MAAKKEEESVQKANLASHPLEMRVLAHLFPRALAKWAAGSQNVLASWPYLTTHHSTNAEQF